MGFVATEVRPPLMKHILVQIQHVTTVLSLNYTYSIFKELYIPLRSCRSVRGPRLERKPLLASANMTCKFRKVCIARQRFSSLVSAGLIKNKKTVYKFKCCDKLPSSSSSCELKSSNSPNSERFCGGCRLERFLLTVADEDIRVDISKSGFGDRRPNGSASDPNVACN